MVPHLIHNTQVFLTLSWLLVLGTKDHASMVGWQWGSIHLSTKLQGNLCQYLQPTYSFIQIDPFGKKVSFQSAPSMFQLKIFSFLCLLEYMVLLVYSYTKGWFCLCTIQLCEAGRNGDGGHSCWIQGQDFCLQEQVQLKIKINVLFSAFFFFLNRLNTYIVFHGITEKL